MIFARFRDLPSASLDVELRRRGVLCKSSTRGHEEPVVDMVGGLKACSSLTTSYGR